MAASASSTTPRWARIQYKALRRNKLVVTVPPHHSSQECRQCGHTHPDNRPSQAVFVCKRCDLITMPAWSFATEAWH
ncbi:zinc ribbon domain-containing protein [Cupriavidus sp. CuC1]|uniref:zinc ribbon domain-containing protein n=1 Tax=Cupriavidus sp. CuC1 TaxID=3373131 RepID=UPI0037D0C727